MKMKYFSAFAGIGGFDEGIRRVFPDAECVGYSETDRYAVKIYDKHFPDRTNYGDIKKIKEKTLPDFDLFCGGWPCQDHSIAGKRAGLCGTRSGLFYEIIRIIRKKQPGIVFLENVKGLFSSDEGRDFTRVLIELDGAGYDVEWQCLNSRDYGVPQNRERVFIIGHSRGRPQKPVFPIRTESNEIQEKTDGKYLCAGTLSTRNQSGQAQWDGSTTLISNAIDANYFKGMDNHGQRAMIQLSGNNQADRIYSDKGIKQIISSSNGGQGVKTGLYVISDSGQGHKSQLQTEIIPTLRANTGAGHNNIVIQSHHHRSGNPALDSIPHIVNQIRRLTPLECERLQGYPDFWTEFDSDGNKISDTQRYKCLGNAVTVNVIEAIMQRMHKNIDSV
jgi:DNA (cytosine-5)-methyltransferase 1